MKVGLVYPQTEYPSDPGAIRDYTQTAEGLGYSHVLAYDHVLGASKDYPQAASMPYTVDHPFMEPLTLFAFMAGLCERIEFATGIIILPQRQTVLFAKQAAVLDSICGGRLRLGVGLGWSDLEFIAMGEKFSERGRRIEEQVEVLRLLWTQPLVDFKGRWHTIPNMGLNPMPVQQPIPLWFGGAAEPALRRAARLGDGWMISSRSTAGIPAALEIVHAALESAGRSSQDFGLEARLPYGKGDPDAWNSQVEAWKKLGVTHLSFNTMGAGLEGAGGHLGAIVLFAKLNGLND